MSGTSANRELMERYWAAAEANDLDTMHERRERPSGYGLTVAQ